MRTLALVPYILVLSGVGLSYAGAIPAMIGWILCALGVLFGLGTAITIYFARIRREAPGFWMFFIVAAAPLVVAVPMVVNDLRYPRINDVTTNIENPPAFVAALRASRNIGRDMAFPKHFGPIIRHGYPNVRPLISAERPDLVFQRVERLANAQPGWAITHRDPEKRTLEGEVTTSFFRFVDDIVVHVSDQDGKTRVDMRSKSRDGLVDAGANAKRIRVFFAQIARW